MNQNFQETEDHANGAEYLFMLSKAGILFIMLDVRLNYLQVT